MAKYTHTKSYYENGPRANDEKRHRSRCKYFRHKSKECSIKCYNCTGASQCAHYQEASSKTKTKNINTNNSQPHKNGESTAPPIPSVQEVLVGKKIISPTGDIGEIVEVQGKALYVKMIDEKPTDKIYKIGFSALKNPPIGRWTAVDEDIQKYILYLLEK